VALGNTPRRETNIAVEASKSYALGMHFVMEDGEPVDLSDCILRFVATEPPQRGSSEVLNLIATIEAATQGLALFRFQAADLTLEAGNYAYDVTLIPPSGYSSPILKGYLEIGGNTDLDDTNVFTQLNTTSDITVMLEHGDVVQIVVERVDGMFLVVSALIEDFSDQMDVEVAKAAASAQSALESANLAAAHAGSMQVWLDNAGYPFWKGTQAEYEALTTTREVS
jgi:hypothetical protein